LISPATQIGTSFEFDLTKQRMSKTSSIFQPPVVGKPGYTTHWGRLYGSSYGLAICNAARQTQQPFVIITPDTQTAVQLEYELRFFGASDDELPLLHFTILFHRTRILFPIAC
jgi:hypothetical protein